MEVKCPKCHTVYYLDVSQLPPEGANVKCTQCQNIFKVFASTPQTSTTASGWHLKKPDGTVINFAHLGELQKLILEFKANLEDMISKDGVSYKRLADMPEFAPLFAKRGKATPAQPAEKEGLKPEKGKPAEETPPVQSVVTPISIPQEEEELDIYGRPRKKKKGGGLLVAIGVIIIVVAVVVAFLFKDKIFGEMLSEQEMALIKGAEEEIRLLDYINLEKASTSLEPFAKSPDKTPKLEILSTYIYALLLRGELLKLENFVIEKRIKEILSVDKYSEVAKRLNDEFNEKQKLVQDLSTTTMTNLKRLDSLYGSKALAKYIALEYIRIQVIFDRTSADKGFNLLKELKGVKDFQYANRLRFIEGDLILKTDESRAEEGIRMIRESMEADKGFLLPYLMLARYFVYKGEYEKAIIEIDSLLNISPQNSVAKALKAHIQDIINIKKTGKVEGGESGQRQDQISSKEEIKGEPEEKGKEKDKEAKAEKGEAKLQEGTGKEAKEERKDAEKRPKADKISASDSKAGGSYSSLIKQAKQYAAKGQTDKAADAFLQAAELEPTLAEPFLLMGWMYIDAGMNEQAISAFSRAIKLKGNRCDGYMGLGEANKYMKRNAEAKKYYQMYLEQCPNGPDAAAARNNLNTLK